MPIIDEGAAHQKEFFDSWISQIHQIISDLALGILTVELALVSRLYNENDKKSVTQFSNTCKAIKGILPELAPSPDAHRLHERLQNAVSCLKPIENTDQAFRYGIDFCMQRQVRGYALVRQVCEANASYGRTDRRTDFNFVLWYDIIDSTGEKSGLEGDALREYRKNVRSFKDELNASLEKLARDFKSRSIIIHPWASDIVSKDDEKNIFFSGPRCFTALMETLRLLLSEAHLRRVRLRLIALNTDFAGYPAHKFDQKPSVDGEAYWEHSSRLKRELRKLEVSGSQSSYLWLAGKVASTSIERSLADLMKGFNKGEVCTTIENYPLYTKYSGGEVGIS
jgi:hypothetical protein